MTKTKPAQLARVAPGRPNVQDPFSTIHKMRAVAPEPGPADSSGFIVGCLIVALPTAVMFFSLGYMSGVWGWI